MSMSIPFLFQQTLHEGDVYVDGALGNPYPIDYYDNGINNVLGIYIESEVNLNNMGNYVDKVTSSCMYRLRELIIKHSSPKCFHLRLISPTQDAIGITLSSEDKTGMLIKGINSTLKFLS